MQRKVWCLGAKSKVLVWGEENGAGLEGRVVSSPMQGEFLHLAYPLFLGWGLLALFLAEPSEAWVSDAEQRATSQPARMRAIGLSMQPPDPAVLGLLFWPFANAAKIKSPSVGARTPAPALASCVRSNNAFIAYNACALSTK